MMSGRMPLAVGGCSAAAGVITGGIVTVAGGGWGAAFVAAALAAAVFVKRPSACVTLLFVTAVMLVDFSPLPVYRYFLVSDLLLLVACALQLAIDRRFTVYAPALMTTLFVIYLGCLLVAFLWAPSLAPLSGWLHFAFLMLVYVPLVTTLLVKRPDLQPYLPATLVTSALIQAVMIIVAVRGGLEWRTGMRIAGAMGSIALWLYVAAAVALIGIAMLGRWTVRLSALVGLLAIAVAEMFLRSRMLWLSSILGICVMLVLQSRVRVKGLVFATGLCCAVAVPYLFDGYPPAIQYRIDQTLRPGQTADLIARMQVVQDLSRAIDDSRGFGIGLGQSERYLLEHHSTAPVVNVHNVVMHATVEGGFLAGASMLLLPLAIFALAAAAARRTGSDHRQRFLVHWCAASLLAIYVGSQLTPTLYEHSFFLLVAALGAAASYRPTPSASEVPSA